MNFSDFANMAWSNGCGTRFLVFDDDDLRDSFRNGSEDEPIFTISSQLQMSYVLSERFAKAKVLHFYANGKDEVDVIIDDDEQEAAGED